MVTINELNYLGEGDIVDGNARPVIETIKKAIKEAAGNLNLEKELISDLLLFSTYAYSSLPLYQICSLHEKYSHVISDLFTSYLLKERIAALIRFENATSKGFEVLLKSIHFDAMIERVPPTNLMPLYLVSPFQNDNRFHRIAANVSFFGSNKITRIGYLCRTPEEIPQWIRFESKPGEAGCIISHLEIWKDIISRRIDYALILEDDVVLMDLPEMRDEMHDQKLDILFVNNRVIPDYRLFNGELTDQQSCLLPIIGGTGMDGYVVSSAGAQKLIELFDLASAPVDLQILAHQNYYEGMPSSKVRGEWNMIREKRNSSIRLESKRLFPFIVDHPPVNYSIIHGRTRRQYAPFLWPAEKY